MLVARRVSGPQPSHQRETVSSPFNPTMPRQLGESGAASWVDGIPDADPGFALDLDPVLPPTGVVIEDDRPHEPSDWGSANADDQGPMITYEAASTARSELGFHVARPSRAGMTFLAGRRHCRACIDLGSPSSDYAPRRAMRPGGWGAHRPLWSRPHDPCRPPSDRAAAAAPHIRPNGAVDHPVPPRSPWTAPPYSVNAGHRWPSQGTVRSKGERLWPGSWRTDCAARWRGRGR